VGQAGPTRDRLARAPRRVATPRRRPTVAPVGLRPNGRQPHVLGCGREWPTTFPRWCGRHPRPAAEQPFGPAGLRYMLLNSEFFVDGAGTISSRCGAAATPVTSPSAWSTSCGPTSTARQSGDGSKNPSRSTTSAHPPFPACHGAAGWSGSASHRSPTSCAALTSHPSGRTRPNTPAAATVNGGLGPITGGRSKVWTIQ
jgi:hypothetical protein